VTQTPPSLRKHPGGDRTGDFVPRSKMTAELAKVINDGLYFYEQELVEQGNKVDYDVADVASTWVVTSESRRKGGNVPSIRSLLVVEEGMSSSRCIWHWFASKSLLQLPLITECAFSTPI